MFPRPADGRLVLAATFLRRMLMRRDLILARRTVVSQTAQVDTGSVHSRYQRISPNAVCPCD